MTTTTPTTGRTVYGIELDRPAEFGPVGVLAGLETSAAGNVILRAGTTNAGPAGPWQQVAHIVLTPEEAGELAISILEELADDAATNRARPDAELEPDPLGILRTADLEAVLAGIPAAARLYAYVGADGVKVQAEWPAPLGEDGSAVILHAPQAMPIAGGPFVKAGR